MKISRLEYNSLVWFLIRGCFIGVTLNNIIYISAQDSAIAIILAILIGFIPLLAYFYIRNYHPDISITEKNKLLFGKFGVFLNIIWALFALGFAIIILSDLTHFVSSQFLYYTSPIVITIVFMFLVTYALTKGIKTISKASLILFFFVMVITLLIIIGLITNIDISNFKPILYNGINPIIRSMFVVLAYNILPIFFLLIIPKNRVNKDNTRLNVIFYLISTLSILSVCFMTISIFGINLSLLFEYPGFHLLRQVNIGEFVDRIEIFLSIEWIISMLIMLIFCLYFFNEVIRKTVSYNKKWHLPLLIIEAIILIILQMFIIDNFLQSSVKEHDIIFYTILGTFILLIITTVLRILLKKTKNS